MQLNDTMLAIFEIMSEGVLIIDKDGCIIYGNKSYCDFIKIDLPQFKGRLLREVRPGAMLPNVLNTKKAILQAPRQENEEIYFVNMYPIFENDEVAGGISIVTFINQAQGMKNLVEKVTRQNKLIIGRISEASNNYYTFEDIIAAAPSSLKTKDLAMRAALSEANVFLQSESGTGKELYAQAIHNAGVRRKSIFLSVNCANFNQNILESELFGYVGGSFTGARQTGKIGLFEAAAGGTIFLDEISEMPFALQSKLLRVLQEQKIRSVGAVEERAVDVRVIAACNADLKRCTEDGAFRLDLFYRLNVFPIHIPPLRERREDIALLAEAFLDNLSRKYKRNIRLEEKAIARLSSYYWPGNVRELRNVLEFMSCLTDDGIIYESMLPDNIKCSDDAELLPLTQRVRAYEKNEITRLLRINGSDMNGKRKTAKQLGISLASLYNKINQ